MSWLRTGFVSLFVTVTTACTLVAGFDGFEGPGAGPDSGGAAAASPGDSSTGSRPTTDAATTQADAEPLAPDAPDPNTPPVFVDGGTFCSTETATFCDDFDTADLPARWIKEGVFARLTSHSSKSAPNDFLLDAPKADTGGTFVSKITHAFTAPSTNLVVGFDFMPERVNLGSSFLILAALEYTKIDIKYSLRLVYSSGSVRLEESNLVPPPNNKDTYHPFFSIPMNAWSRVKLDVVASGPSPGVTVSLDGIPVGVRETLTPTAGIDATPTLILGAVFAGNPHTGWGLRYDNVTVTYR